MRAYAYLLGKHILFAGIAPFSCEAKRGDPTSFIGYVGTVLRSQTLPGESGRSAVSGRLIPTQWNQKSYVLGDPGLIFYTPRVADITSMHVALSLDFIHPDLLGHLANWRFLMDNIYEDVYAKLKERVCSEADHLSDLTTGAFVPRLCRHSEDVRYRGFGGLTSNIWFVLAQLESYAPLWETNAQKCIAINQRRLGTGPRLSVSTDL